MKRTIFLVLVLSGCGILTAGMPLAGIPLKAQGQTFGEAQQDGVLAQNVPSPTANPRPIATSSDRVLIEPKTVTFTRGKKGQDYPDYKEAVIKYPQITGLEDQAILRQVQTAVSLKSVFGQSLDELQAEFQESWWLSEIDYAVNYNQHSLLDLTFTISGVGAYPSTYEKQRVLNLKTGKVLKAIDIFKREALGTIALKITQAMQSDVKQAIANADREGADIREELKQRRVQSNHLDHFSISDKGVTFLYDFDFPHVMKALEPSGKYFFSYQQLKLYIKPDGALGFVLPALADSKS